jgi:hypothetical protein
MGKIMVILCRQHMMDLFCQQFAEAPLDFGIGVVGRKLRPPSGVCPASHDKEAVGECL